MGKKWRVDCGGKFLGHYPATTIDQAISKAIAKNKEYYPQIDFGGLFTVTQGSKEYCVFSKD